MKTLLFGLAVGFAATAAVAGDLQHEIEAILKETGTPGIGIAVVERGKPMQVVSAGLARLSPAQPVTEQTMFRTASAGKMFTALAAMRLVEQGKLSLDAKLSDLAPEVRAENRWESTHPVRVAHLLEHTTGWDDIHNAEYAMQDTAATPIEQGINQHWDSRRARWMPGTREAYSNMGPMVAGYLIQKISGQRFEDFVTNEVFRPLHMDSVTYFADARWQQHGATLYRHGQEVAYRHILYRPAGSTNATVADMGRFVQFFLDEGRVDGAQLYRAESLQRMAHGETSLSAAATQCCHGLGMLISGYHGVRLVGHAGSIDGARSDVVIAPERGVGFVAMINDENEATLEKVRQLLLERLIPAQAEVHAPLAAEWRGVDGLYGRINPRSELSRLSAAFMGTFWLRATPQGLEQRHVLGFGRTLTTTDAMGRPIHSNMGMPVFGKAIDPLAGAVLLDAGDVLAPRPVWLVLPVVIAIHGFLLCSVLAILWTLVWLPRRLRGQLAGGPAIDIRLWPLASTISLVGALALLAWLGTGNQDALGNVNAGTIGIMLGTGALPILAVAGVASLWRHRHAAIHRGAYWFAAVHSATAVVVALALASQGLWGLRMWL